MLNTAAIAEEPSWILQFTLGGGDAGSDPLSAKRGAEARVVTKATPWGGRIWLPSRRVFSSPCCFGSGWGHVPLISPAFVTGTQQWYAGGSLK